jgi:hypothetical protein
MTLDPPLDEIGRQLHAAAARRTKRMRRRRTLAVFSVVTAAVVATAGGVTTRDDSGDAFAARVVERTYRATTRPPAVGTILHVVTRLETSDGNGTMESWQAGARLRRVGYHTDGSVHAEETQRRLPSGVYEYRSFHRNDDGSAVTTVSRGPHVRAPDIDLIDPARDLRAAVDVGELRFVRATRFEGEPAYELALRLDAACGVILDEARVFVERGTYRPIAVRLGPGLLRFVTIEEIPFEESLLTMNRHPGARVVRAAAPSREELPCSGGDGR